MTARALFALVLLLGAPGMGYAQAPERSVWAATTWVDAGSAAPSGLGASLDWARVQDGRGVSAGVSWFTAPWASWRFARSRLDLRLRDRVWLEARLSGGAVATPAAPSDLVLQAGMGVSAAAGIWDVALHLDDIRTQAMQSQMARAALGVLVGGRLHVRGSGARAISGADSYGGVQVEWRAPGVRTLAGWLTGSVGLSEGELESLRLPGRQEWYMGTFVDLWSAPHSVGLMYRRRDGSGSARSTVHLVVRVQR